MENLNYSEHAEVCECGYTVLGWHGADFFVNSSLEDMHHGYCKCGYPSLSHHVYVAAGVGVNYNWICHYCGKTSNSTTMPTTQSLVSGETVMLMALPGVFTLPDGTTLQILTETGSYVLSNGVIVLSPEDAALVEAGLLDPYELVENITVPSNPDLVTE